MDLNDNTLQEVTDFAVLPSFTPKEIAIALGLNPVEFIELITRGDNPVATAYQKGKLLAKAELDKRLQTLSKQGSGPAQTLEIKMRKETKINKLLDHYG
jgi:bifunctional DNA-binding transcriptional regulator/antitoxin component of YhaV-PrlF toxin-antitoxin module